MGASLLRVSPGVKQNFGDAARWYRRAGGRGFTDAQCNLGGVFGHGRGVKK
jgi:TPR repeat protein